MIMIRISKKEHHIVWGISESSVKVIISDIVLTRSEIFILILAKSISMQLKPAKHKLHKLKIWTSKTKAQI